MSCAATNAGIKATKAQISVHSCRSRAVSADDCSDADSFALVKLETIVALALLGRTYATLTTLLGLSELTGVHPTMSKLMRV